MIKVNYYEDEVLFCHLFYISMIITYRPLIRILFAVSHRQRIVVLVHLFDIITPDDRLNMS